MGDSTLISVRESRFVTTAQVMDDLALPNRRSARSWMERAADHSGIQVLHGQGRAESRIRRSAFDGYLAFLESGMGAQVGPVPPVLALQAPSAPARPVSTLHAGSRSQAPSKRLDARRRVAELPPDFGGLDP
jgi:hypothetical protein